MLLELAIADAYSVQWNNALIEYIQTHNDLSSYSSNNSDRVLPGYYTGITQSNIAIAEMLILGYPWIKEFLANSFVVTLKRDPRSGYPDSFEKLLSQVRDGGELIEKIDPYQTKGNCAVRAIAIGILSTPEKVIKATITQAAITNNNPNDFNASLAVSLMSHYFIYRLGQKNQLKDFLNTHITAEWLHPRANTTHKNLIDTALAIEAVIAHHSLSKLLQECINIRENASSISAIAVAAASCSQEYVQDLPGYLVDNLENTRYGRDYLIELDQKLLKRAKLT